MQRSTDRPHIASPHQGIVYAILGLIEIKSELTHDHKLMFARSLNWIIDNEKDKEVLAWAYNLRGCVYMGWYPEVCE